MSGTQTEQAARDTRICLQHMIDTEVYYLTGSKRTGYGIRRAKPRKAQRVILAHGCIGIVL